MQLPGADDDELPLLEGMRNVVHDEVEAAAGQIGDLEAFVAM